TNSDANKLIEHLNKTSLYSFIPASDNILLKLIPQSPCNKYLSFIKITALNGWSFDEGECLSIDLALTFEAIEVIINLTKDNLSLVSLVNTNKHKANFLDFFLKIEIGIPRVAVLYTPGHFSTVLISRVSQSKVIIYSFDSQGNGAKYNIEAFLEDNLELFEEKNISFEIISPLFRRQQKNEPLCYAYAIKDALLLKKCLEEKKIQITGLHKYFFSSIGHYNV
ncbi:MAG: hypothetical protein PSV35_01825, partial [bacterium]|nr:hypothetical protein [bacterium]